MTRSGARPARAMAGGKRSRRVTHHKTLPRVRAAIPAANKAAAAPSTTPLPPPATSCSAPSARPPPGKTPVDLLDAEWKRRATARRAAFEALDALSKLLDGWKG